MSYRKFELIVPVFFGCLGSLVISAFLMMHSNAKKNQNFTHEFPVENSAGVGTIPFFAQIRTEHPDFILELYRDPQSQKWVIDFFTEVCASPELASVILANADAFDIAPALAFSLAWEESRLNPHAVNDKNRNESIDRGLFQLNNRSFPSLEIQSFFNPRMNAWYAMNHLRHCLNTGGTEVAALAMYNAGSTRVNTIGAPKSTLDYISRIMENRREIEDRFKELEAQLQEQTDDFSEIAEVQPERPRLVPLMPLAGK